MNSEELESLFTNTLVRTTIPSQVFASNENEKGNSKECCKPYSLGIDQCGVIQGCASKSFTLHRCILEPVLHQALNVFLSDTVIPASVGSTFKGHFDNLTALVESSSRSEALPFALEAVALASLANRFSNSELRTEAMRRYIFSINRLRKTNLSSNSNVLSIIACIMLLCLYEITNANTSSNLDWIRHLRGMIAVIKNLVERDQMPASGIPMLLVGSEPLPNFIEKTKSRSGHLSAIVLQPATSQFTDLCSLLPKARILFKKSASLFEPASVHYESPLRQLREETISLKSELLIWSATQPETTRPKTIERFTQEYTLRFPGIEDLVCPITRADIYKDYFMACMWNSYRQCQLHLTNLLSRINQALNKNPESYKHSREQSKLRNEARSYVDDICASIPFMLAGAGIRGNKPIGPIWVQARPPMLIGGFNLQWVLFTISILEIIPMNERRNMKTLLFWIGKNLGIRQATVLAQMERNPPGCITAKGDALRWTGFLV